MIKELIYNGITYTEIKISDVPVALAAPVSRVNKVVGGCIKNSYWVAKLSECEMVEGFLVTQFPGKEEYDVVGHAWNSYKGIHFDVTLSLTPGADGVTHQYFVREIYNWDVANITWKFYPETGEKLDFKTNVNAIEQEVRAHVNQKD